MSTDFTIVLDSPQHFGNTEGRFKKDVPDAEFVGQLKTYTFGTPRADGGKGLLMFEALGVNSRHNVLMVNGKDVSGGLRRVVEHEWQGHVTVVPEGAFRPDGDNELLVESRTLQGESEGNLDDFVVTNVVAMFKTAR